MSSQSLVKLGPRTTENGPKKMPHPLKLNGRSELNRNLTDRLGEFRLRENYPTAYINT